MQTSALAAPASGGNSSCWLAVAAYQDATCASFSMPALYGQACDPLHNTLGVAPLRPELHSCDTGGFPPCGIRMKTDTQAIHEWLKQHKISEVECLVPDMTGNARGKFVPAQQFLSMGDPKLPESIMIQTVTG